MYMMYMKEKNAEKKKGVATIKINNTFGNIMFVVLL